jgi:GT2 family glycosyltransferase/glycosyltransferase involved in cell wall biosynthesis
MLEPASNGLALQDKHLNEWDAAMEFPLCSLLVVNYNGRRYLDRCLLSLEGLDYREDRVEILLIDNGSDDGSELKAQSNHPRVRLLRNPVNNFAAALNLGVSESKGSYVAFINNDVFLSPSWLKELVGAMERDSRVGCAGGKILFEDGRINSVGHRALPDFYWEDEGCGEVDHGQYDEQRKVTGICWAAVLFRKTCLDDVGPIDQDYIFYFEDVDTSLRCRQRGWKMLYTPGARAEHVFHGSSNGNFAEYFCDRARLIHVAKFHPEKLPAAVQTTRFLSRGQTESLYDMLPIVVRKLIEGYPADVVEEVLNQLCDVLVPIFGALAVDHLISRMQVILGHRKVSIGFYDHALDVIGGGQKYGCTMAASLQDKFDVTLISNKPVTLDDLEAWYGLPLSRCRRSLIPIPYFDQFGGSVDSKVVSPEVANPFETVRAASQAFDVFVNVNMLTMVRPVSPFSIFLCHFPDVVRRCFFAVEEYSCLVVNSLYTAQWVKALWGLEPDLLLYPPVDMTPESVEEKENIILSVARFEVGGSKKQLDLIQAFERLRELNPILLDGWKLVLAGGSVQQNPYLEKVLCEVRESSAPISLRPNISISELKGLYAKAKIFWHACGLGEIDPHLIEHFGMATVEAMQNRCVPIVFDGGGQREIVEHGRSGYRFSAVSDLCNFTLKLIESPDLMEQLKDGAYMRGQAFTQKRFEEAINRLFGALEEEYRTMPAPDPGEILRNRRRASLFYIPVARQATALLQSKSYETASGHRM